MKLCVSLFLVFFSAINASAQTSSLPTSPLSNEEVGIHRFGSLDDVDYTPSVEKLCTSSDDEDSRVDITGSPIEEVEEVVPEIIEETPAAEEEIEIEEEEVPEIIEETPAAEEEIEIEEEVPEIEETEEPMITPIEEVEEVVPEIIEETPVAEEEIEEHVPEAEEAEETVEEVVPEIIEETPVAEEEVPEVEETEEVVEGDESIDDSTPQIFNYQFTPIVKFGDEQNTYGLRDRVKIRVHIPPRGGRRSLRGKSTQNADELSYAPYGTPSSFEEMEGGFGCPFQGDMVDTEVVDADEFGRVYNGTVGDAEVAEVFTAQQASHVFGASPSVAGRSTTNACDKKPVGGARRFFGNLFFFGPGNDAYTEGRPVAFGLE